MTDDKLREYSQRIDVVLAEKNPTEPTASEIREAVEKMQSSLSHILQKKQKCT